MGSQKDRAIYWLLKGKAVDLMVIGGIGYVKKDSKRRSNVVFGSIPLIIQSINRPTEIFKTLGMIEIAVVPTSFLPSFPNTHKLISEKELKTLELLGAINVEEIEDEFQNIPF